MKFKIIPKQCLYSIIFSLCPKINTKKFEWGPFKLKNSDFPYETFNADYIP
jgi:hypothetical protein